MSLDDLMAQTGIWRGAGRAAEPRTIATGFAELDRVLPGGGWPRNALTEILFERFGVGELRLLMPALACLGRQSGNEARWIVWIAPPLLPYAPALVQYGLDLDRILLVHPRAGGKDALWAAEQAQRSGSSMAVLVWLERVRGTALRRLQIGSEERDCLTVLFRPLAALGEHSPAALRLRLSPAQRETEVELVKCRGRRPGTITLDLGLDGTRVAAEHSPC